MEQKKKREKIQKLLDMIFSTVILKDKRAMNAYEVKEWLLIHVSVASSVLWYDVAEKVLGFEMGHDGILCRREKAKAFVGNYQENELVVH